MTNSEQAIREFAEKWARLLKSKDPNVKEMFIAHHNVFVSEHYYPKEKYDELLQQRDELRDKYSKLLEATSEFLKSMKTDNAELKKSIAEMSEDMASEAAAIKNTCDSCG